MSDAETAPLADVSTYLPEKVNVLSEKEKATLAATRQPVRDGWYADPLTANQIRYWSVELEQWTGRTRRRGNTAPAAPSPATAYPSGSPAAPAAPAGWYTVEPGLQRWWDGQQWIGAPVPQPPGTAAPPAASPAPAATPVAAAPASGTTAYGYPRAYATNADGTRTLQDKPPVDRAMDRSGWYTASWFGVFLFTPLAIVGGLIDNSISKKKGLPPRYTAIVLGAILFCVGLAAFFFFFSSTKAAACNDIANQVVDSKDGSPYVKQIDGITPISEGVGDVNCTGLATYSDGSSRRLDFYSLGGFIYWEPA